MGIAFTEMKIVYCIAYILLYIRFLLYLCWIILCKYLNNYKYFMFNHLSVQNLILSILILEHLLNKTYTCSCISNVYGKCINVFFVNIKLCGGEKSINKIYSYKYFSWFFKIISFICNLPSGLWISGRIWDWKKSVTLTRLLVCVIPCWN